MRATARGGMLRGPQARAGLAVVAAIAALCFAGPVFYHTDQVHVNTKAACTIHDPAWNRRIVVEKSGSESTVVWNPWMDKTKGMSDMTADGWKEMLCIESANAADNAIHLPPGESHKLSVSIRVE